MERPSVAHERRRAPAAAEAEGSTSDAVLQRIANLLALLLVKGESETDKVVTLAAAGFTPTEIAALLGKQQNTVSVLLYKAKQVSRRAAKKAPARPPSRGTRGSL
jgi:DNA-directed RNA polymerase specialized sigma24 family protein